MSGCIFSNLRRRVDDHVKSVGVAFFSLYPYGLYSECFFMIGKYY